MPSSRLQGFGTGLLWAVVAGARRLEHANKQMGPEQAQRGPHPLRERREGALLCGVGVGCGHSPPKFPVELGTSQPNFLMSLYGAIISSLRTDI